MFPALTRTHQETYLQPLAINSHRLTLNPSNQSEFWSSLAEYGRHHAIAVEVNLLSTMCQLLMIEHCQSSFVFRDPLSLICKSPTYHRSFYPISGQSALVFMCETIENHCRSPLGAQELAAKLKSIAWNIAPTLLQPYLSSRHFRSRGHHRCGHHHPKDPLSFPNPPNFNWDCSDSIHYPQHHLILAHHYPMFVNI